jgi:hypothetical protein
LSGKLPGNFQANGENWANIQVRPYVTEAENTSADT